MISNLNLSTFNKIYVTQFESLSNKLECLLLANINNILALYLRLREKLFGNTFLRSYQKSVSYHQLQTFDKDMNSYTHPLWHYSNGRCMSLPENIRLDSECLLIRNALDYCQNVLWHWTLVEIRFQDSDQNLTSLKLVLK